MPDDAARYTFKIADFTPDTMPFSRLLEYYAEIRRMLGVDDGLHLVDVVESSHGSVFAIDRSRQTAVARQLLEIREGTAAKKSLAAHNTIDVMLKEDGTSASFLDPRGDNIVDFPGTRVDQAAPIRIRDAGTFIGELYHIAGTKDDAKVRITTDAYGVVFCTTTRDIAKSMRDFLFENIQVSGRGTWTRGEDGAWRIGDFSITDFAPVQQESLRDVVNRIRDLNINWPEDPIGLMAEIDEKNGHLR